MPNFQTRGKINSRNVCDLVKALYDTRQLKQMLYRLKYTLVKPDFLPEINYSYFPNWRYFGFIDPTERKIEQKTTIFRRKSIDQLFTDENLRLVEAEAHFENPENYRTKDSLDTKYQQFGSFGSQPFTALGIRRSSKNNGMNKNIPKAKEGLVIPPKVLAKDIKKSAAEGEVNGVGLRDSGRQKVYHQEDNFSSNEELFRSNESKEENVKINPDLLLTLNDKEAPNAR